MVPSVFQCHWDQTIAGASMTVPDKLHELVDRFQYHIDDYKSGKYNETQVRWDFIDPLFVLLGWDIDNKANHAEAYRDVIHEDSIKIGGATIFNLNPSPRHLAKVQKKGS